VQHLHATLDAANKCSRLVAAEIVLAAPMQERFVLVDALLHILALTSTAHRLRWRRLSSCGVLKLRVTSCPAPAARDVAARVRGWGGLQMPVRAWPIATGGSFLPPDYNASCAGTLW
jgi:hypothetical protein